MQSHFIGFLINVFGWLGTGLILLGYLLISVRKTTAGSFFYQSINVFGAAAIGVSSFVKAAWPAAALNFSWMLIGIYALVAMLWRRKSG